MSKTIQWQVDAAAANTGGLVEAASILRAGGTVAFPTETVYGLGADARSTAAVEQIFIAKGRPADNPLIVHIAELRQLAGACSSVWAARETADGTILAGPADSCASGQTRRSIAARDGRSRYDRCEDAGSSRCFSAHRCRRLSGCGAQRQPLGQASLTLASHVLADLDGRIDGIVDGGAAGVGLESTVVEIDGEVVRILRPGGVTAEALREIAAHVAYDAAAAPSTGGDSAPCT